MAIRALPLILASILLAAIITGCPVQPADSDNTEPALVTIVVTRDFGKELILAEPVEIEPGTSALAALQAVAEVETKYGGGFVQAINGRNPEEAERLDWFYYINGIALSLGARDYPLNDGDIEHWDLRDWSYLQFVPAIIGAFPQPFLSGLRGEVRPTAVVYELPFAAEAEAIAAALEARGATEVLLTGAERLDDGIKQQSNLIIVAGAENGLILELGQNPKKMGFFAHIEGGKITVLDGRGEPAGEYRAGWGLLQASQNPWSPGGVGSGESVVFMVSGADENGVRSAANALINNRQQLGYAYAALVNNNDIIKIP